MPAVPIRVTGRRRNHYRHKPLPFPVNPTFPTVRGNRYVVGYAAGHDKPDRIAAGIGCQMDLGGVAAGAFARRFVSTAFCPCAVLVYADVSADILNSLTKIPRFDQRQKVWQMLLALPKYLDTAQG